MNFTLVKGDKGDRGIQGIQGLTGNGISSITKTGTNGLVDTYTITYTNGNTTTFTITNGEDGEVTETELNVLRQKVADQQKVIDQLPQVEGQGTSITLENTIEAQFTKFDEEGNSTQETTEGYNMLDLEKYSYSESSSALNGGTVTIKDGVITLNATNATGNMTALSVTKLANADSIEAGTYYFGVDVYGAYESTPNTNIWEYRGNRTLTEKFIIKQWKYAVTKGNIGSTPILVSNDTSKTTYEPYTGGQATPNPNYEQPIESAGDNGSINEKIKNKNFANNAGNGYIASDGGIAVSNVAFHNDFIPIPENETKVYYYGSNLSASMSNVYANRLFFYDENKGKVTVYSSISTPTSYTIPNGAKYVRASWLNAVENPMLVFGGAIPYVPHEEQDYSIFVQQPMRSIGDVRDCFVKVNGNWYKYEVIKKIVLTGNENWIYYTNVGEPYFFYTPDYTNIIKNKIVDNSIILCNYFQNRGKTYKPSGQGIFVNADFSGKIENGNLSVTTYDWGNNVETFKQFLREKKPEVYFAVKEPTEIEITDETLIAQLDAMQELRTYKNVTHISSQDETPAYLEVSGIYDLNKLINN